MGRALPVKVYYVRHGLGASLINAVSRPQARSRARRLLGTDNGPYFATLATEDEKAWVNTMGGVAQ